MTDEPTRNAEIAPQAMAAARWWADALRDPKQDNGDGMFNVLLSLVRSEPPSDEQLDVFTAHLARAIDRRMVDTPWMVIIGVDYGPDPILAAAADAAGIRRSGYAFPVKTCMWIKPGVGVTVSCGYRAPDESVWSAPQ